ncbi:unnamed protein product [Paramecium octaurelia]|uniref:Uncharacterized protein n=1 Tax=Paramecium octaurelia TaxID=43137 RepID=A0A8S1YQH7_PAROT|nr:unnamed protein product [Paramecium octaurelia]CAD8215564.1 unnamed protein product [Paramecium octaurelia]
MPCQVQWILVKGNGQQYLQVSAAYQCTQIIRKMVILVVTIIPKNIQLQQQQSLFSYSKALTPNELIFKLQSFKNPFIREFSNNDHHKLEKNKRLCFVQEIQHTLGEESHL